MLSLGESTQLLPQHIQQNLSEKISCASRISKYKHVMLVGAFDIINGVVIDLLIKCNNPNAIPLCQMGIGACTLNIVNATLTLVDKKKLEEEGHKFKLACYNTFKTINEMASTFSLPIYLGLYNARLNVTSEEAGDKLDLSRHLEVGYLSMNAIWEYFSQPIRFIMPNSRLGEIGNGKNRKLSPKANNDKAQLFFHLFRTAFGVGLAVTPIFETNNSKEFNKLLQSWGFFEGFHIVGHFAARGLVKLWTYFLKKYQPTWSRVGLDERQLGIGIGLVEKFTKGTLELTVCTTPVAFLFFQGSLGLYAYLGTAKAAVDYCLSRDFECATKTDFRNRFKTLLTNPEDEACTTLSLKARMYRVFSHSIFWLSAIWLTYGIFDSETEKDKTDVGVLLGSMLFAYFFKGLMDSLFKAEETGRLVGQGFYSFSSELGFAIYFEIFNQFVGVLNNKDIDKTNGVGYIAGIGAEISYAMYVAVNYIGAGKFEMPSGMVPYGTWMAFFQEFYADAMLLNNGTSTSP